MIYKTGTLVDRRGNKTITADGGGTITVRAAFIPQRSSRAEVAGQQQINVIRMIVASGLPDVNLWSRVEAMGKTWDFVTPPQYHHGTRKTRHWGVDLRERP